MTYFIHAGLCCLCCAMLCCGARPRPREPASWQTAADPATAFGHQYRLPLPYQSLASFTSPVFMIRNVLRGDSWPFTSSRASAIYVHTVVRLTRRLSDLVKIWPRPGTWRRSPRTAILMTQLVTEKWGRPVKYAWQRANQRGLTYYVYASSLSGGHIKIVFLRHWVFYVSLLWRFQPVKTGLEYRNGCR